MNTKTYEYFVKDLVAILKDEIETAFNEQNTKTEFEDKLYDSGKIFSLYSVLSLINSQAVAFQIPLKELKLEDYNLERFLIEVPNNMSENITVYEKPTCTTCRNLNKLFEENGVDYRKVNYFIEPLTVEKLKNLLSKANLSAFEVVRKNEAVYKDLKIAEVSDEDKLIELIVENPSILQRPIVEIGDRAVLARPIEKALELIKSAV